MMTILYLIGGHYLADFALQNDYVANNKAPGRPNWVHVMTAHCAIHGMIVLLITHSPALFTLEFLAHFGTDTLKCRQRITFTQDQLIHVGCKLLWIVFMGL